MYKVIVRNCLGSDVVHSRHDSLRDALNQADMVNGRVAGLYELMIWSDFEQQWTTDGYGEPERSDNVESIQFAAEMLRKEVPEFADARFAIYSHEHETRQEI